MLEEAPAERRRAAVEVAEPAGREAEPVPVVDQAKGGDIFVRVPPPEDPGAVEVADERRHGVERLAPVVLAARRLPAHRVEAVRPGCSRHRAEPAVAHGVLAREVVVDREVGAVVVPHHGPGIRVLGVVLGVAGDEPSVFVRELLLDVRAAVTGILVLRQLRGFQVVDPVGLAGVRVRHRRPEPVDREIGLELQVAEHVVE
jgi:hypothetical protein